MSDKILSQDKESQDKESQDKEKRPLKDFRVEIDQVDRDLVSLLARRMDLVREIGDFKKDNPAAPLRDEDRERQVFEVWARRAKDEGLSPYFIGRVLREVLNYSRRDQERLLDRSQFVAGPAPVRVGYQGMPGSYSDLTITKLFSSRSVDRLERIGFQSFSAAADALEAGQINYALLPIENSVAGSIDQVYDLLSQRKLTIVGEEVWPVEHCLLGLPEAKLEDLRVIRSHPVALQQCGKFLRGLVGTRRETFFDTAGAARSVSQEEDPTIGAIASEEAAKNWGLEILRREVADQRVNLTRFLLIGTAPEPVDPRQPVKTSLVMVVRHQPGALLECLRVFDDLRINLSKLESRPLPEKPWAYRFFVDLEGHGEVEPVRSALAKVRRLAGHLKVLGSYTRRTGLEGSLEVPAIPSEAPAENRSAERDPSGATGDSLDSAAVRAAAAPDQRRSVQVGDVEIGGGGVTLIVRPHRAHRRKALMGIASAAREAGGRLLLLEEDEDLSVSDSGTGISERLALATSVGHAYEMPVIATVRRPEEVAERVGEVDMVRIGASEMENPALLDAVGRTPVPVLLERGLSATLDEALAAADRILAGGNQQVVLCERGIRTFETSTRATLDLSAIPILRSRSHLPIVVDPCQVAGPREVVGSLARAAAAAGADGLILEVDASDEPRAGAMTPEDFQELAQSISGAAARPRAGSQRAPRPDSAP